MWDRLWDRNKIYFKKMNKINILNNELGGLPRRFSAGAETPTMLGDASKWVLR